MTRERIDDLAEARRLNDQYHRVQVHDVRPDDHVGQRPVHGVAGTDMNGIEVELSQLARTANDLAQLHEPLMAQLRTAVALTDKLEDGSGPVAAKMRRAFLQRADADGGVQTTLQEYMEELFGMRVVIMQTLASYQRVDDDAVAELSRQIADFRAVVR